MWTVDNVDQWLGNVIIAILGPGCRWRWNSEMADEVDGESTGCAQKGGRITVYKFV